jgi:hypothetical protein
MAALANLDYIRVRIYNENPSKSQVAINTLYYQITALVGAWTPVSLAAALGQTHSPLFRGWQSPQTRYAATGVARVRPNPTPEFKSTLFNGPGTTGGSTFPTQVTGLCGGRAADYHTGSPTAKHPAGVQVLAISRIYVSFPAAYLTPTPAETGSMSETLYQQLLLISFALFAPRTVIGSAGASMTLQPVIRWSVDTFPPTGRIYNFTPVDLRFTSRLWATQRSRGDRGQHELFAI